jgi:ATP-dependent DNA helicase RecG
VPARQRSEHELTALLEQGLGPELHWFPEDVAVSRLASTFVGMANGTGGTVLLGITPRSPEVIGVTDPQTTLDRIFQAALLADPPLVLPIPQGVQVNKVTGESPRQVLWVTIPKGLPHVYNLDGRYLGRQGASTSLLTARQLRQLLMERGVVQLESGTPDDAGMDDLDPLQIEAYLEHVHVAGIMPNNLSVEELLLRRGCIKRVHGEYKPTYAALLLFGRYPQRWLANASILAGRFSGLTLSDEYIKQDITGTLPEQIRQANAFVQSNLKSVVRMNGLNHREIPEYPYDAVRELLVNAVAHRDYNVQGDNIHLFIFANRLEVHSPGGLPGPVNLQNMLNTRFARNAVIMQVLSDLGFVERLGYGLNRVVESMRQAGMQPPHFDNPAGSFRVTLFNSLVNTQMKFAGARELADPRNYQNLSLNPRQQAVLEYLMNNQRITSHQYQTLCPEVHSETLRRDLADMVGQGILIKIGDKRATYYILKRFPEFSQ